MKKIILAVLLMANSLISTIAMASEADDLAYYQQFIFEEKVNDTDPENVYVSSRYLMSQWDAKIALPTGDNLNIVASILLFKDFSFELVYKENVFHGPGPGFMPGACKMLQGTWSVENGRLLLPGFGYLEKSLWQGQNAVTMTITEILSSEAARGFSAPASYGFSNMSREKAARCFPF